MRHRGHAASFASQHDRFSRAERWPDETTCTRPRNALCCAAGGSGDTASVRHFHQGEIRMQSSLLSAAVVSALALSAVAFAGDIRTSSPALRAQGMLDGAAAKLVRRDAADRFVARDVIVDRKGNEHVRFARTYRGLPVIGGSIVMHSRNGVAKSVTQTLKDLGRPNIVPSITQRRAITEAGARFGTGFTGTPSAK